MLIYTMYVRQDLTASLCCCVRVYVPPTAKVPPIARVIWRRDLGLKSQPKDWTVSLKLILKSFLVLITEILACLVTKQMKMQRGLSDC